MCFRYLFSVTLLFAMTTCNSQNKSTTSAVGPKKERSVGGPCEGCDAIFEFGDKQLSAIDTLPDFEQKEPKLKLTGTVFEKDGKTPAENVILYIYQTDQNGIYPKHGDEKGWAKRHGYIRGWIKTGKEGKYTFLTFRPGAYPNRREPEHIHITVKEENKNEYYMDEFVFDDDPLLTMEQRATLNNRGGSGISKPTLEDGILTAHRDIILGKNIPNYE